MSILELTIAIQERLDRIAKMTKVEIKLVGTDIVIMASQSGISAEELLARLDAMIETGDIPDFMKTEEAEEEIAEESILQSQFFVKDKDGGKSTLVDFLHYDWDIIKYEESKLHCFNSKIRDTTPLVPQFGMTERQLEELALTYLQ